MTERDRKDRRNRRDRQRRAESAASNASSNGKISEKDFVLNAIKSLRDGKHKGIHTVYSGFNQAFREYYSGDSPVEATNRLTENGVVVTRPVKGGVMLYDAKDLPENFTPTPPTAEVLQKIIG